MQGRDGGNIVPAWLGSSAGREGRERTFPVSKMVMDGSTNLCAIAEHCRGFCEDAPVRKGRDVPSVPQNQREVPARLPTPYLKSFDVSAISHQLWVQITPPSISLQPQDPNDMTALKEEGRVAHAEISAAFGLCIEFQGHSTSSGSESLNSQPSPVQLMKD